jgi:hypothetical protein
MGLGRLRCIPDFGLVLAHCSAAQRRGHPAASERGAAAWLAEEEIPHRNDETSYSSFVTLYTPEEINDVTIACSSVVG